MAAFEAMQMTPEQKARVEIDRMLREAGWLVQDVKSVNLQAGRGVAIREFPLERGFGFADYLLYVDGKAAGVIEAKKAGTTLSGVEIQSDRYSQGLSRSLPNWFRPLPFYYESTGVETCFTSGLDSESRSRPVFSFHRPETLSVWREEALTPSTRVGEGRGEGDFPLAADPEIALYFITYRSRLRLMPTSSSVHRD
jgi:type I restriction enzyme R subunit